jgi:thymidylate synthase (FAD)
MTKVLDHGHVDLVDSMPAGAAGDSATAWGLGDQRIVDAARVSIAGGAVRPTSDNEKLLRYLLVNQHTTPFETVRFTFDVKLPIFIARQWIRHRMGSFNEMSARYGVLPDEFYAPESDRMQMQATNNKQGSGEVLPMEDALHCLDLIQTHSDRSYALYKTLLGRGLARELARMVLPLNIYTQWMWTTDLHNLMHFLRLRLHSHAQYEIRVYAEAIVDLIRPLVPCAVKIFEETLKGGKP